MEPIADPGRWNRKLLEVASAVGSAALTKLLLEAGVDFTSAGVAGRTPAYTAARNGHLEVLKLLLEAGADITTPDNEGRTPVYATAFGGHVGEARLLLEHAADVSIANEYGMTPLNLAASDGHFELAELFLASGADVDEPNSYGWTPLHSAAYGGHVRVVELLVNHGADVSTQKNDGWTPLHSAVDGGHVWVAELLVDHGADISTQTSDGWGPLRFACDDGRTELVELLVGHGADANAREGDDAATPLHSSAYSGNIDIVRTLLDHGADPRVADAYGDTPLFSAAVGGNDQVFQLLMDNGADCLVRNKSGWSPLHHACFRGQGTVQMVRTLLGKGAAIDETTEELWTPLNLASRAGSADIVALLLDKGADPSILDRNSWSPLHTACLHGHVSVVNALLDCGVSLLDKEGRPMLNFASLCGHIGVVRALFERNPEVPPARHDGQSPVVLASCPGHSDVVRFLVSKGFTTTDAADDYGATALHCAAELGHADVARALLEGGAAMTPNKSGYQPIHTAAAFGKHEVVKAFIENGADVSAPGGCGLTALHLASQGGHTATAEVLLEHGADPGAVAENGTRPVHSSSIGGHVGVLQLLLAHGADASAEIVDATTPLHLAVSRGYLLAVRLLLANGAGGGAAGESGVTPLHAAAGNGHVEVLEELLGAGANHEATDKNGRTALSISSELGNIECMRRLLEHGADVSARDIGEAMPIHWAAFGGHAESVNLLLEHGSGLSAGDGHGKTPLALATLRGHAEVTKQLIEKQADPRLARNDGRQPVGSSLFTLYLSIVDQEQRFRALEASALSAPFMDRQDDWQAIQYLLLRKALATGPANTKVHALLLQPAARQDTFSDVEMSPGGYMLTLSSGSLPPITKPKALCYACSAVLQSEVGKVAFDGVATAQDVMRLVAGDIAQAGPSGRLPQKSNIFYHHMSVHGLAWASSQGCYICRALWDRLGARRQQLLLDADPLAHGEKYGPPLTMCMFIDTESFLGGLELYKPPYRRLWAAAFSPDVHEIINHRPDDVAFFELVAPEEVEKLERVGDLPPATNSSESLHFAATQLQNCLRNHELCRRPTASGWLPSRLICLDRVDDAKTVHLELSRDVDAPTEYCTLSHCWGTAEILKLTKGNRELLFRGIPVTALPKTFQDSFDVVQKLGVRYIWIDSLCIVQDDPDDWLNEASHMGEVYSHSLCNICATAASDSSKGLFVTRDPALSRPCEAEIPWCNAGGRFRVLDMSTWRAQVLRAPLNMRAWVVQEHLLAPRHLHFGASQIFWECIELTAAEQFPDGLPECMRPSGVSLRRQLNLCAPVLPLNKNQDRMLWSGWEDAVRRYTRSGITLLRDRAIAFAGIVRRLEGIVGDKCDAGIWRSDIMRGLLWNVISCRHGDGTPARRPEAYRAPSFSWMSVEGAVDLMGSRTEDSPARVLSMDITESRGLITGGSLRLEGTIKPLRLLRGKVESGALWVPRFRRGMPHLGWTVSLGSVALMDADRDYNDTYYCVFLAGGVEESSVQGLVLKETGTARGKFTRIGYIRCLGEDKELLQVHTEDEDTFPCESYDAVQKRHTICIV